MRIRIFSDTLTSLQWKEKYEATCFQGIVDYYKKEKDVVFVDDDTYTHAILLDQTTPSLLVPKERTMGMSLQNKPRWKKTFVEYAKENMSKYYVGDEVESEFLGDPFVHHCSFVCYSLPTRIIEEKTRYVSLCLFDSRFSLGYFYSNKIADLIIENNLPIDIFGKTEKKYIGKKNKTGKNNEYVLKETYTPTEPYENYAFSIVIEENKTNSFFSDRPITSMMCQCVPLYYGCDNMEDLGDNIIRLTGNLASDMNNIVDILKKPSHYYKEIDTNRLNRRVNLLKNAKKLFQTLDSSSVVS